jgi:hypothetical protein
MGSGHIAAAWARQAAYRKEFLDAVKGRKFRNPSTGNEVKFVSLPKDEQARLYQQWVGQKSEGPEVEKIRAPSSPERYSHVDFSIEGDDDDDSSATDDPPRRGRAHMTDTKLMRRVMGVGNGSHRDRLLDLAGMGALARQLRRVEVTVDWDEDTTSFYVNGSGDDGLYFERTIQYSNPPGKRSQSRPDRITNFKIETDKDAPEGIGTRMLMGQVLAAEREGFQTIETEAQGSPGSEWSGYYVWPRLGYDGDIEKETLAMMSPALRREIEKIARKDGGKPRFSHLMMLPKGRSWWKENGHSVDLSFDARAGSRSREVLEGYVRERARKDGKSPTDYMLRRGAKTDAPGMDDDDEEILATVWDAARRHLDEAPRVAATWMRRAVRPIPVDKEAVRAKATKLSEKLLKQLEAAPPDRPVRERQVWVQDSMPVRSVQGEDLDAIVVVRAGPAGGPGPYIDSGGFGWHQPTGRPVVIVSLNGHYTPKDLARSLRGSPELIQDMIYTTLLHEATHASDVRRQSGYQVSGAGEQYTTDDLDRYYNDPHEVRAFMQQVVDETERAFGDRQETVLEKFGESRGLKMILGASDTWREINEHLHEDNRRKMIKAVHRALSDRREKARGKASEPSDDFWQWMGRTVSGVPNPNPDGRERTISPATLRGYAESGDHRDRARRIVERYQAQYKKRDKERDVAAAWVHRVVAKQTELSEFRQEVESRKFRNPDTGNDVLFVSLPKQEQARIFAEWRRKQRGGDPKPERERGLVEIDREKARDTARRMTEEIGKWKVRAPDEPIGDRFLPGGGGPITYGRMFETSVKGRPRPFPVQLGVGEHGEGLWRAGRHFVSGGGVQFRHLGEKDEGFPISLRINLNPKLTYRELQDPKAASRIEQEIYSVMIHEMTHARDVIETPAQVRRRRKKDIPERPGPHDSPEESEQKEREHFQGREREYYNRPSEARAFKRQVAEEFRRELEKIYKVQEFKHERAKEKGEDIVEDPDWISMDADSVMTMLERSPTWDRVREWLTPANRRKYLETVASIVRTFKEQHGGKVATRKIAAAWLRKAISEKYVRPLKKVDTDDLPFDHLFEGRRRMVVDPEDHGGLGASEPDSAKDLEKFLRANGALKDDEQVDWKQGYVIDGSGKTKSKVGKAFQNAVKNFVGGDREFYANRLKVQQDLAKGESPLQRTLGIGRDQLQALTGMGHLLVEGFPTSQIWEEIEKFGVPSPDSWKRIKEVADRFAALSPDERDAKTKEHEAEYHRDAEVSEDFRKQYWAARGLFQTHNKTKSGDEADWLMRHFREWAERTDDFYESDDAEPLRKMHELGSTIDPGRFEELRSLQEIEKKRQSYDLWRSIRGQDLVVVLSRDPVDVLRMSDYPKAVQAIQSCHSEGGSEFQCAIEEAEEGGMIAYVVRKSDVEGRDLDEGELFEDQGRDVEGIKPYARLRLRRFENDTGDGLEVAVPETTTYGADFPDFVQAITNWARGAQPEFVSGDAGYSPRPRDWRLTGGTYQDNTSSDLFNNFLGRDEDDRYGREPTEDEYDPYGEGFTLEDSPYYNPDREDEDEDEGEAEVASKAVQPWRHTDHMTDFWGWMKENHPQIRNPNPRGTKEHISPATLKGYARGATIYSRSARELVGRYLSRYQQERSKHEEGQPQGDVRASRIVSAWLLKVAKSSFSEWVKGKRFKNPATGNEVLFSSLPKPEQEKIRASWGQRAEDSAPAKQGPAADIARSPVHQSAVFGRVVDRRTPKDDRHQERLSSAMQDVSERAEKIDHDAKLGSWERKKLYEEGPSILARYIRTGRGLTDEEALKVLATHGRYQGDTTDLYRGITGVTSEQVEGLLGFVPAEDTPVAVEYTDGRFLQPAQSLASSWSASSKVAHDFAARGVGENQWNVLFVARTDEEEDHGNFVAVHYDHLGAHDQEQNEDSIYERAFQMALKDDPDALEGFDSWEDIQSSDEDTDAARKAVEDNYQYAVEELGMEGEMDNPEGFEAEEEMLGVGPVRVGRVYVFRKPGELTRMLGEAENEELDVLTRMAGEDEEDTDKTPKRVKVKKEPFRIDRFVVPADQVFPQKASPPLPKKS